jgi:hypothetical protein
MKLSKKYLEEAKCELSTPTPEQVMFIETKEAISPSPNLALSEEIPPPPPESPESEIPPPPPESPESEIPPPPPESPESGTPLVEEISKDYSYKSPVKSVSMVDDDQLDPDFNIVQTISAVESYGSVSKEILTCDSILKSGSRKGQKCGKSAKVNGKCNVHKKSSQTASTSTSTPLEEELIPPPPPIEEEIPSPPLEEELIPPPPPIEEEIPSPPLEEELIPPPPPSPPIEQDLRENWPVIQIEEKQLLNMLKKADVMNLDTMQLNYLQQELDKIFS